MVESQLPMGDFHRPIKSGTYTVEVKANGYYPAQYNVTVVDGETTNLTVELEAGEGLIPDFSVSETEISLGSSVQFFDETWGTDIVSWCWRFDGGNPETSSEQNPVVKYEEEGSFDVTLTATNASGDSETITKRRYINVTESYNMQDATITTCGAMFYDYGGPNGNYPDNDLHVMTFKPATEGAMIQVEFLEFSTEGNYDVLRIYNGSEVGSSQCLAELSGSSLPGKYTATNTEGALTFRFLSDYSMNYPGWKAVVRCVGGEMTVTADAGEDEICLGESVELFVEAEGGSGEYTYSWSPAELFDDPNAQNVIATPTEVGEMTFVVTVSDGTSTKESSVDVLVKDCTSVGEDVLNDINIYPNPAKDMLFVNLNKEASCISWTMMNVSGQTVKSSELSSMKFEIDLKDVESGFYFLNIIVDDNRIVRKIVVE